MSTILHRHRDHQKMVVLPSSFSRCSPKRTPSAPRPSPKAPQFQPCGPRLAFSCQLPRATVARTPFLSWQSHTSPNCSMLTKDPGTKQCAHTLCLLHSRHKSHPSPCPPLRAGECTSTVPKLALRDFIVRFPRLVPSIAPDPASNL